MCLYLEVSPNSTEATRTLFYKSTSRTNYAWRNVNAFHTTKTFIYLGYQYTQVLKSGWGKLYLFYQVNNKRINTRDMFTQIYMFLLILQMKKSQFHPTVTLLVHILLYKIYNTLVVSDTVTFCTIAILHHLV
jgi:hypothetical protein